MLLDTVMVSSGTLISRTTSCVLVLLTVVEVCTLLISTWLAAIFVNHVRVLLSPRFSLSDLVLAGVVVV